jgi:excisionase family DNA binding protein
MPTNRTTFTVSEVAARFGVGAATVGAWIRAGELLAVNVSRSAGSRKPRWRITPGAVEAFEVRRAGTPPVERKSRRRQEPQDVIKFYA